MVGVYCGKRYAVPLLRATCLHTLMPAHLTACALTKPPHSHRKLQPGRDRQHPDPKKAEKFTVYAGAQYAARSTNATSTQPAACSSSASISAKLESGQQRSGMSAHRTIEHNSE